MYDPQEKLDLPGKGVINDGEAGYMGRGQWRGAPR